MRMVVPDLVSPSYFPAIAAVEFGYLRDEGVDMSLDLFFPVTTAAQALNAKEIDFLAGAAHAPLYTESGWAGTKLIAALSENTYWFLVVRADLADDVTDVRDLRDLRIGVAPGPDLAFTQLLRDAGVDAEEAGLRLGPIPGEAGDVSFGVSAAAALAADRIDGFWANGMGAEVATRRGVGRVVLDARRDPGPIASFTFPAMMVNSDTLTRRPDVVAAVVRSVVRAQRTLRESPQRAREIGERLFPPMEGELIAELVRRDAPYYSADISEAAVAGLSDFARRSGLADAPSPYAAVVAQSCRPLWWAAQ